MKQHITLVGVYIMYCQSEGLPWARACGLFFTEMVLRKLNPSTVEAGFACRNTAYRSSSEAENRSVGPPSRGPSHYRIAVRRLWLFGVTMVGCE
jgi:hypothetical protein